MHFYNETKEILKFKLKIQKIFTLIKILLANPRIDIFGNVALKTGSRTLNAIAKK